MTPEDIRAVLEFNDKDLINEIHDLVLMEIDGEKKRFADLEAKAAAIRGQMGTCVTVVSVVGAALWQARTGALATHACVAWLVWLSFALSLAAGVVAFIFSVLAFTVKTRAMAIDEVTIFNSVAISTAAKVVAPETPVGVFRRYMTEQYAKIRAAWFEANEQKAGRVRVSQWCFLGFLVLLASAGVFIGLAFVVL